MRTLIVLFAAIAATASAMNKLSSEFMEGFETGVYLRDEENALKDYSCPAGVTENVLINKLGSLVTPMKLASSMMKDSKLDSIINTVEVFTGSLSGLMAVFQGNYDGGDFCSGLIFGKEGTNMLFKLAYQMTEDKEEAEAEEVYESKKSSSGKKSSSTSTSSSSSSDKLKKSKKK
uniref:Uncharacterized protein n=1 Tax=Strombidinopsis acuminata TaxID=141414 RepID=A0A7S3VZ98_9SPIT|mmetsp:Transcript_111823/g.154415  ORF Transcript_111823/g.154415 Transcript_111823/m.154415 type:complete len:175 (+) Transcript_111823:49-573(+)|eukprot:CAMPEP_0176364556 /NCGR_PEP_ID=MMETSP0126-20121128/19871_1 /TAXON_ID=141414 ORGANISM="Strombidinopsis acuminatum, Strain SPMC142" /NCGR_SAMPLE_ID=MMETSP0126 /ASSEMBLY_ACC=CAM_ASM_000229 /LENGTH=174 /DNA_ID=CAMNT_0017721241 /DNA_START=39 /DNA_END=563 /DNA_ORIENTATION=-